MNLIFFEDKKGEMIAVNPEQIVYIDTYHEVPSGKEYTRINFNDDLIAVRNSFDSVVAALRAWRGKV